MSRHSIAHEGAEPLYTTADLARVAGQSRRTIQLFLKQKYRKERHWYKFTLEQFEAEKRDLANYFSERKRGCRRRRRAKIVVTQTQFLTGE